jgi:3-hydroxybutyryl-CoA dehydratase
MKNLTKKSFPAKISERLHRQFAELSGDKNPIHTSDRFAKQYGFSGKITYGMIAGALFSKLFGNYIPGHGSLLLSINLMFRKPMAPGKSVVVSGEIVQIVKSANVARIKITVKDKKTNQILVSGETLVRMPIKIKK